MMKNHYENFPVASILLPRRLRKPIQTIYTFARTADDLADEGELSAETRLAMLGEYRNFVAAIAEGDVTQYTPNNISFINHQDPSIFFRELQTIIRNHKLPTKLFLDLLAAFSQDVKKNRYFNFMELSNYCVKSANPVGRILLHLFQENSTENLELSDKICTSLQLINFLQDVSVDFKKDRIYLPQDEMIRFNINENQIRLKISDKNWRNYMSFQIGRIKEILNSGKPLTEKLKGRVRLEIKLVIAGGERILEKLEHCDGDIFRKRPKLTIHDWILMGWRTLTK